MDNQKMVVVIVIMAMIISAMAGWIVRDEQTSSEQIVSEQILSEVVGVIIGEEVTLPLAENWTVCAESLWINKDYYENRDFSNLSNAKYIVPHKDIDHLGERVNLWLSTDQRPPVGGSYILGKSISLSVGGAGTFYNFSNNKEYVVFFEDSGQWSSELNLWVRLRVRQL